MKKGLVVFLVTALLVFGSFSVFAESTSQQTLVLKAGHAVPPTHPYHLGLAKFAELVAQRTGNRVQIQIFPNAQLGNERDMIEGLQIGTIDLVVSSTGPVGNFAPKMMVVDLPFLFRDRDHAYKVLDGEIGKTLLKQLEPKGIRGLAFWENGFRHLTNSKRPINGPADLKGLKFRTMENEVHMASFKALGANPSPMAWSEVFTALQQKVIDGQENPIPIIYTTKIYEVQKYLALTGHFYSPALLLISQQSWSKLTPEEQQVFATTAQEVAVYERNLIKEMEDKQISELKAKGMIVTTPDKTLFRKATQEVYKKYEDKLGKDLVEKILETR
ncbi:MAG: TRAP transporter substrate-binding protein [Syntrophothermus sp.]